MQLLSVAKWLFHFSIPMFFSVIYSRTIRNIRLVPRPISHRLNKVEIRARTADTVVFEVVFTLQIDFASLSPAIKKAESCMLSTSYQVAE